MSEAIEIRILDDGAIQARRLDGKPLTPEDRAEAKRTAASVPTPMADARQSPMAADRPRHLTAQEIIDINAGKIIAVLMDCDLGPLWFAFVDDFCPGDEIPVFYPDEFQFLKDKLATTLRKIYETKCAFGLGTKVRH